MYPAPTTENVGFPQYPTDLWTMPLPPLSHGSGRDSSPRRGAFEPPLAGEVAQRAGGVVGPQPIDIVFVGFDGNVFVKGRRGGS